jgi:hypothetical protein
MEYFVRHVVDVRDKHESWALIDRKCMPELEDGRVCEEEDVYAVASSRAELELKMASLGLGLKDIDNVYRMTATQVWTAWSVGKVEDDD